MLHVSQSRSERRIVSVLEPVITSHRLVINTALLRDDFNRIRYDSVEEAKRRFYRLTYQFTRMTRNRGAVKHDDRIDSLASGVAHFQDRMQEALDKAEGRSKEEALEREAEKVIQARLKAGLPVKGWLPNDQINQHGFGRDASRDKGDSRRGRRNR